VEARVEARVEEGKVAAATEAVRAEAARVAAAEDTLLQRRSRL